MLSSKAFNILQ